MKNVTPTDEERNNAGLRNFRQEAAGKGGGWWKMLIGFLLLWVVLSLLMSSFGGPNRASVSYTKFKQEVADSNVARITMKGEEISGAFRRKTRIVESPHDTTAYKYFSTMKPEIQDPALMALLSKNNVSIYAKPQSNNAWLTDFIFFILPWILIIGYFVYARNKMRGKGGGMMGGGGLFGIGKSTAKRFTKGKTDVTFNDVAGLMNAKRDLQEIIDYLKEPGKFSALGADIPKGVLLMGPPGIGKTLLARATAGEADVPFFSISGSEFIEMFVGVGASRVRDMFANAKKESPSVIFIDEIDSVGRARGTGLGGGHDEREQTLNQILSEMDGFERNESVVVMAATNRPDVLDAALTRPGRFDRRVILELPHNDARKKILEIHTRHVPLSEDVDLGNLAARTVGFSGADLKNLVNEAALLAGRKMKKQVGKEDFDDSIDKVMLGAKREDIITDEEKKVIAYHEAGHTLVAKLLPGTDPLQKVTIIPRGRALGVTEQVPEIERHNLKRQYLLNRVAVSLGGRVAEKIVFDDYTNGAESDLKSVTSIAKKMVCQWGMSDRLGPVAFKLGEDHPFLGRELGEPKDFSESTGKIIDEEIQKIIRNSEQKVERILTTNRAKLDALAGALLENETLEKRQIDAILEDDRVVNENPTT